MAISSKRIKFIVVLGICAFASVLLILSVIIFAVKDKLFMTPQKKVESQLTNTINEEFSIGLDTENDYDIYELQEDGSYIALDYKNNAEELTNIIFSNMTYEVMSVSDDSCVIHVKAPDYKLLFCNACGIDPEKLTITDEDYDSKADYIGIMINKLNSGEYEYIETDILVPLEDGKPQLTYELIDAFYGNMYSFTEELFNSDLG